MFIRLPFFLILAGFTVYYALGFQIRYNLDVYLENISDDKNTGTIRGIFYTFYNLAWFASPFLAGILSKGENYSNVYLAASFSLLPFIALVAILFSESKSVRYDKHGVWDDLRILFRSRRLEDKDIRRILAVDFVLNLFYAVMVVYMPIYLHEYIGLSWPEIGLVFSIMLLPFVLFELPLGRLADRKFGEKEFLLAGIAVCGLSTLVIPFLETDYWVWWAIILFMTRVGAATMEITKECYLFKKIDGENTGIISLARINVPFSYLVGPIFATLILLAFDMHMIFLVLGGVMVTAGWHFGSRIRDTK